ncbi:hypothetical protein B5M43_013420 [Microbacterium sp. MEC084]|uniref:hypothetical protein n=1 Tax=Microbacterium sp. MEC084 TaxID=1963027 RepID=UPI0010703073|nr:hypothetical protein [Microbacterium sp. MEC084]MCD1269824.1 hypothetical protein [Microbacterium sp. MEC084]
MNAQHPSIHEWWPKLSIQTKEALRESAGDLTPEVREEISQLTGTDVPEGASLSEEDRDFIRTQSEPVD